MKKLLTLALVFVFALALVFALGCNKKEEMPATESEGGMEQTMPEGGMDMDSTGTMASPDSAMAPAEGSH